MKFEYLRSPKAGDPRIPAAGSIQVLEPGKPMDNLQLKTKSLGTQGNSVNPESKRPENPGVQSKRLLQPLGKGRGLWRVDAKLPWYLFSIPLGS